MKKAPKALAAFLSGYAHCDCAHYRSTGYTNPRGYLKNPRHGGLGQRIPDGRRARCDEYARDARRKNCSSAYSRLDGPEKKLIEPLIRAYPGEMSDTELCGAAGYQHERSTGYTNPRGRLHNHGLIERDKGTVNILFPYEDTYVLEKEAIYEARAGLAGWARAFLV